MKVNFLFATEGARRQNIRISTSMLVRLFHLFWTKSQKIWIWPNLFWKMTGVIQLIIQPSKNRNLNFAILVDQILLNMPFWNSRYIFRVVDWCEFETLKNDFELGSLELRGRNFWKILNWVFVILEPFRKIFSIQHHHHSRWHLFRLKIVEDFEFRILSNCLSDFVLKTNRLEGTLFSGSPDGPSDFMEDFVGDTGPDGWIRSCWGVFSSKSSPIDASECAVEYVLFCFGNFPFSVSGSFSISVITDMLTCGSCADFGRNTADDIVLWLVAPVSVIEAFDWLRCNDSWFSGWSVLGPWRELTDWRTFVFCLVRFIFASLNSRTRYPWNGQIDLFEIEPFPFEWVFNLRIGCCWFRLSRKNSSWISSWTCSSWCNGTGSVQINTGRASPGTISTTVGSDYTIISDFWFSLIQVKLWLVNLRLIDNGATDRCALQCLVKVIWSLIGQIRLCKRLIRVDRGTTTWKCLMKYKNHVKNTVFELDNPISPIKSPKYWFISSKCKNNTCWIISRSRLSYR